MGLVIVLTGWTDLLNLMSISYKVAGHGRLLIIILWFHKHATTKVLLVHTHACT